MPKRSLFRYRDPWRSFPSIVSCVALLLVVLFAAPGYSQVRKPQPNKPTGKPPASKPPASNAPNRSNGNVRAGNANRQVGNARSMANSPPNYFARLTQGLRFYRRVPNARPPILGAAGPMPNPLAINPQQRLFYNPSQQSSFAAIRAALPQQSSFYPPSAFPQQPLAFQMPVRQALAGQSRQGGNMNLAMQQWPRQAASPAVNMPVAVGRGAPAVGSPGRNAPPRYDRVPPIVPQPKQIGGKAPPKPPRPSLSPYGLARARQPNIVNPISYSALPNGGNKAAPKSGSGARLVDRQVAAPRPIVPSNNQTRAAASPSRWQRFKAFVSKWVLGRRPAEPGRVGPVNPSLLNAPQQLANRVPSPRNNAVANAIPFGSGQANNRPMSDFARDLYLGEVRQGLPGYAAKYPQEFLWDNQGVVGLNQRQPAVLPMNKPAGPAGPSAIIPAAAGGGAPLQGQKAPNQSPRIQKIPTGPSDSYRKRNPYGPVPTRGGQYDIPVLKNGQYDAADSQLKN